MEAVTVVTSVAVVAVVVVVAVVGAVAVVVVVPVVAVRHSTGSGHGEGKYLEKVSKLGIIFSFKTFNFDSLLSVKTQSVIGTHWSLICVPNILAKQVIGI